MTIKNTQQKVSKKFDDNFDAIFGKNKPTARGAFTQAPNGKLVPRGTVPVNSADGPMVMKPMQDFKSPIDGSIISSRQQLNAHNKRHGVTNSSDYSDGYVAKRADARNKAGEKYLRDTRRSDINSAISRHT